MSELPSTTEAAVTPVTAVAALKLDPLWLGASAEQRELLEKIAQQRDRLGARKAAQLQARALQASLDSVPVDAPLPEKLLAFARLHPVATAAVAGLALFIGPRKLIRTGAFLLPLLAKFKR